MKRLVDYLDDRPEWQLLSVGAVLIAVLGVIDYLTGDFSLTLFYLLPVFLGAWFVNRWSGMALSLLSGLSIAVARGIFAAGINFSALLVWNLTMELLFLVIMSFMFSALRRELDTEKSLARQDHLTGAFNRRSFLELSEYEIRKSRRFRRKLTIAYLDLDNFKAVNDRMGHHVGDNLLVTVVQTIMDNTRGTDVVARLGGDEFCVLFPETEAESAAEVLDKLQARLLAAMAAHAWPVTFSIGAITYNTAPVSAAAMMMEADAKMYSVKRDGKNMVSHVIVEAMQAEQGVGQQRT